MTKRTHYQVLHVTEDASQELIEASWRGLVRRFHPDSGREASHEKMILVNAAHDVLSDPAKRTEYDAELATERVNNRPKPVDHNRAAYPPPYPEAYPGIQFDPLELANVAREAMTDGLLGAAHAAGQAVVDHLAERNPILKAFLKRRKKTG